MCVDLSRHCPRTVTTWYSAVKLNLAMAKFQGNMVYIHLYPTYDVDQSYRQGNILHIAMWLGQYLDITLW